MYQIETVRFWFQWDLRCACFSRSCSEWSWQASQCLHLARLLGFSILNKDSRKFNLSDQRLNFVSGDQRDNQKVFPLLYNICLVTQWLQRHSYSWKFRTKALCSLLHQVWHLRPLIFQLEWARFDLPSTKTYLWM